MSVENNSGISRRFRDASGDPLYIRFSSVLHITEIEKEKS
uniref:Uncharacterized protein n=1 Tax=Cucumis melo TaxID=3656 RepID=A0A9I9EM87_CUCME